MRVFEQKMVDSENISRELVFIKRMREYIIKDKLDYLETTDESGDEDYIVHFINNL